MKTYCSKCGTAYKVAKSQKNSYMFCLNCDQFFKIIDKPPVSVQEDKEENIRNTVKKSRFYKKSVPDNVTKAKSGLIAKLKKSIKDFFGDFPKPAKVAENTANTIELLPEEQPEFKIERPPAKTLIDDFLGPDGNFMNQTDELPAEYLNSLSSGVNTSPTESLKANARNQKNSQKISVSANKNYNNITIK
jgi:hypothetical protein